MVGEGSGAQKAGSSYSNEDGRRFIVFGFTVTAIG